jgi:hypothetical protein
MMGPGGQMGMMGDMKQMMPMMRNMMTMMGAQSGMMAADVEERIASLRTELKITDAQAARWNRFADALRATAKSMNGMFEQMMPPGGGGDAAGAPRTSREDDVGASECAQDAQGGRGSALCGVGRRSEEDRRQVDDRADGHDVVRRCTAAWRQKT